MAQHDLGTLARMLDATNGTEAYRSAVSTGTIFWALGVLREVLGLVAADHDEDREDRQTRVEVLRSWCTALRTRPRRIVHQGLLDRAAAYAVASFLSDVAEVRGASDPQMRELVDVTRAHVAAYESFGLSSRAVCFCRARGCERNEHFVRYALRYMGTSPEGCANCPVRPLHYALGTKNDFMVRELIACGADVNATGPGLSTSMHWAATEEHMLIVLKAGFAPSAMGAVSNGGTVWEYHEKRGTVAELRSAVARAKSRSFRAEPRAKRQRVSIEVVPREELWCSF
jgi:hypothetical protein